MTWYDAHETFANFTPLMLRKIHRDTDDADAKSEEQFLK